MAQANALKTYMNEQVLAAPATTNHLILDAKKQYCKIGADDYIRKASWFADRLGFDDTSTGEKAWSEPVPLPHVFSMLRAALLSASLPPTVTDVE